MSYKLCNVALKLHVPFKGMSLERRLFESLCNFSKSKPRPQIPKSTRELESLVFPCIAFAKTILWRADLLKYVFRRFRTLHNFVI